MFQARNTVCSKPSIGLRLSGVISGKHYFKSTENVNSITSALLDNQTKYAYHRGTVEYLALQWYVCNIGAQGSDIRGG